MRRIKIDVLMNAQRAVAPVAGGNQAQPIGISGDGKNLLFVARRDSLALGQQPNLQQMHFVLRRGIEFAVQDAGPGAHALHLARPDD